MANEKRCHTAKWMLLIGWCVAGFMLAAPSKLLAQAETDLVREFDDKQNVVQGDWEVLNGQLRVIAGDRALAELPGNAPDAYRLTVEFTRTGGDDSVGIIVPVGSRQCIVNLGVFGGEAHGIGTIDGRLARDNDTTIRPGTLVTGQRYRLVINVAAADENGDINSTLDEKPFLSWSGQVESLALLDFWKLPRTNSIGLFANCDVIFHRISLQPSSTTGPVTTTTPTESSIQFQGRRWATGNAQDVTVETLRGRPALHVVGREAAFVPIVGAEFGKGTIEVDIASGTFSGIGFRGNDDGTLVEKVYFRPQNSGTAKHDRSVQYSLLGKREFHWSQLRANFPGKYESGADIPRNDWFHVRVVVDENRATVFVNDDTDPVLVVDDLLSKLDRGTIGVWGWDSYFSNFQIDESS